MDRTIEFACEVDPLIANFSMMTPYPGTKVYEIAKRQGRLLLEDWEDYVFFDGRARYELGDMTAESSSGNGKNHIAAFTCVRIVLG
jgi:radical SAM superfamily enzyme YgiQ (UPF0313 family)